MLATRIAGAYVIVCSIDLMGGMAVQLERGERLVLERGDVLALAERFGRLGEIAVIDLDAALDRGNNRELIERLCRIAQVRVGGGIRDAETARRYLRAGAQRVILGTAASPELLRQLPRERTIVAIDARGERVASNGWRTLTSESPLERACRLQSHCGGFLFTDIEREGMLGGIDIAKIADLKRAVGVPLTAAGGIRAVDEIVALDAIGVDAQVGMALYTGLIDATEAFAATIDFARGGGLVPTIVCDAQTGRVRMLGYSSRESLLLALREGRGVYWSRSRSEIWRKGETSGAGQRLIRVAADCDRDALIFSVEQTGATCHSGTPRCFDDARFAWDDLVARIDGRSGNGSPESYTCRLLAEPALLNAKLREEIEEVVAADTSENLAWECADVLYFLSVKMRAAGVRIDDVMAQLAARAV